MRELDLAKRGGVNISPSVLKTSFKYRPPDEKVDENTDCIYIIARPMGTFVTLKVRLYERYDRYDYPLEIRDGGLETSPLIGRFSEGIIPASIQTIGSRLWMR